jgi:3,4-dihydroxy 2-butanone 4-phosphate synthase/GTP cyclohydrolase II
MQTEPMNFNHPEELIEDIRHGKMVILVDDEDRENEGDLVLAADHVTPQMINFMAKEARGLICLALSAQQVERLQLQMMVREDQNGTPNKTAFTVSIEASTGVSTGISAADRAHTIKIASHPEARPSDVRSPGHIFPIRAQNGGVLKRAGHTEGSVDLAKLAGLNPAAVICEIMKDDGTMARVPDLVEFAKKHGLKIGTIVDLIQYRLSRDILVEEVFTSEVPPAITGFRARVFRSRVDGMEHLVLQKGEILKDKPTPLRVHQDNFGKEVFQLLDKKKTHLQMALEKIETEGHGVLLLLRGYNKPDSLSIELKKILGEANPVEMDHKDYGIGAQILRQLGIGQIRLITNKIDKRVGLKAFDLEITETIPLFEDHNG